MKTTIEIETQEPRELREILEPSLKSRGNVEINTATEDNRFKSTIKTKSIGPLRGTTDNVFRLATLTKKIKER